MRQRKEDEQERKSILIVHLESLILCQALFKSLHVIIHLTLTAICEVGVDTVFILQLWKMMYKAT